MTQALRQFEPSSKWAEPDGTLTQRAIGWQRDLFRFLGVGDGTVPVTSLGGDGSTTTRFYREDGTFAVPAYPVGANPTASAGLSAVNGSAATFLRSDGAPAIDQAITPTWTGAHAFSAGITGTTINFSSSITGDSLVAVNGFGCNGKTAQTEVTVNAAVVNTAATNITPYGYTTQSQADDIVTLLNQIRAALVANGILV